MQTNDKPEPTSPLADLFAELGIMPLRTEYLNEATTSKFISLLVSRVVNAQLAWTASDEESDFAGLAHQRVAQRTLKEFLVRKKIIS